MNARPRLSLAGAISAAELPSKPGVYAFYREGGAVYVGKAKRLNGRLRTNHLSRGVSLTNSALRRNVAEALGIASAADIKAHRYRPTSEEAANVADWIRACQVAWIECATEADAITLEKAMKREWMPPLTKQ
jgi:GIY-YIG catalytic domain